MVGKIIGNMVGVKFLIFGLRLLLNAVGFVFGLLCICLGVMLIVAAIGGVIDGLRDWGRKK